MSSLVAVHASFETHWPYVARFFQERWGARVLRVAAGDSRPLSAVDIPPADTRRAAILGVPLTSDCIAAMPSLTELSALGPYGPTPLDTDTRAALEARGIRLIGHRSEGFWGQSVSEFALGLTWAALRGTQRYSREMLSSTEAWRRYSAARNTGPDSLGEQMSDDTRFTSGTLAGKRVRIVGAGNIGARYASFCAALGADVAIWDPLAAEPAFHRAGARREWHLDRLIADAEIFAPMMPLLDATRGIVAARHIQALPTGCLVLLVTRAGIVDMPTLRARVLNNELALAADVFDIEPVPFDDPLLGRDNVTHTPHLAGRTVDSNRDWVDALVAQFSA
jgi:phosphoglycerate dehydrogenase-like enzyme